MVRMRISSTCGPGIYSREPYTVHRTCERNVVGTNASTISFGSNYTKQHIFPAIIQRYQMLVSWCNIRLHGPRTMRDVAMFEVCMKEFVMCAISTRITCGLTRARPIPIVNHIFLTAEIHPCSYKYLSGRCDTMLSAWLADPFVCQLY